MRTRRLFAGLVAAALLMLGPLAGPAAAHVSVSAPDATAGGYAKLTFLLPTEKEVPTTKVEIAMPTDTPIASVLVQPHAGWTYAVTTAAPAKPLSDDDGPVTQVVSRIVFTAIADGIKPGEFDEFDVSAGPLPEADQVVFKVLQTYGDGSVASWIQQPVPGAPEPEFPAPILDLGKADASPASGQAAVISRAAEKPGVGDKTAITLSIAALVVGILALLGTGYVVLRRPAKWPHRPSAGV